MKWIIPENSLRKNAPASHTSWAQLLWRWTVFLHDLLIWSPWPTPTRPTDTTATCFLRKNLSDTNWNSWVFRCESQSATSWSVSCFLGIIIILEPAQLYGLLYMYPYGLGLWVMAWVWLGYATYIAPSWIPRDLATTHITIFSPRRGDVSPPPGATFLGQNRGSKVDQKPWVKNESKTHGFFGWYPAW